MENCRVLRTGSSIEIFSSIANRPARVREDTTKRFYP